VPTVADVTFTLITQGVPFATDEALRLIEPAPALAVKVPPVQPEVLEPGGVWTTKLVGNASEMVTPVRVVAFGLVMVMVISELLPVAIEVGAKVLVTVGGLRMFRVAEAVPPVPPFVELTAPVVLLAAPTVESVTLTEMEQLAGGAAMLPPVRVREVSPPLGANVPPQVFVALGVAATLTFAGSGSVMATPDSATVLAAGFVMVIVSVEVAPMPMLVGAKVLVTVGGATTTSVAMEVLPTP